MLKIYFESGYNFKELLKSIFLSSWFYEDEYKMNKVKTPVELLVGFQRKTGLRCNGIKTTNYFLKSCGQRLFYPPNISGWPYGNGWLYGEALVNESISSRSIFTDSKQEPQPIHSYL